MTRDECKEDLVSKGVPEFTARKILGVLDCFGPFEVSLELAGRRHRVRSLWEGTYEVDELA